MFIFNLASIKSEEHHSLCFTMCICASYTVYPYLNLVTLNILKIVIFELIIRGVKTLVTILVQ